MILRIDLSEDIMDNFILFFNQFLSYILLMAIIVAVGAVGFVIGVKWWKANDAKTASETAEEKDGTVNEG